MNTPKAKAPLKIACIGEAMIEMIIDPDTFNATLGVAGDVLNTAIYLRRSLGQENLVAFVSTIGHDKLSDRISDRIKAEDVSTDFLQHHPTKVPGIYSIQTTEDGERSFSYWRDASAARTMFSSPNGPDFSSLASFDVVFFSAITLAILPQTVRDGLFEWIATFRARGGRMAFDSNYRPLLWTSQEVAKAEIERAWSMTDIALPSVDDEMALFGDLDEAALLDRLRGYGVRLGALKRGDKGPLPICDADFAPHIYPAAKHVVDTTAAGDGFDGAFLASYLTHGNLASAMKSGHECAIKVIAHRGAIIPRSIMSVAVT